MTISNRMTGRDLYLYRTDAAGNAMFTEHRVWDADRFMAECQAEAEKQNAEAEKKGETGKATAQRITQDQFKARSL